LLKVDKVDCCFGKVHTGDKVDRIGNKVERIGNSVETSWILMNTVESKHKIVLFKITSSSAIFIEMTSLVTGSSRDS